jgi:hypothetical protein
VASNQPNDSTATGQSQMAGSSGSDDNLLKKKQSSSPWDEELPEEPSKDQKIGGFSSSLSSVKEAPKEEPSFVVPENIENQTPLNIVDGNDIVKNNTNLSGGDSSSDVLENSVRNGSMDLDIADEAMPLPKADVPPVAPPLSNVNAETMKAGVSSLISNKPNNVVSAPVMPVAPVAPVVTPPVTPPVSPTPVTTPVANEADDLDIFDNKFSSQKAISGDIMQKTAEQPQAVQPQTLQPEPAMVPIAQPSPTVNVSPLPQQTQPIAVPLASPVAPSANSDIVPMPKTEKKNAFASMFKRKPKAEVSQPAPLQSSQTIASPVAPSMAEQMLGQPPAKKRLPLPLIIVGGVLSLIVLLIFITENGMVSIGFEKVYNPLGLEIIWGGLPKDAEKALGKTIAVMKSKPSFTVTGDIRVTIDKTIESPISTPLVSFAEKNKVAVYVKPQKAILAVTSDDGEWVVVDPNTDMPVTSTDTTSQSSPSSNDLTGNAGETATTSQDGTTQDSTTTSDSTSTSADATGTDQQLDGSYENAQSNTKEVSATIEGAVGKNGSDLILSVDKAGTSQVSLKNNLGKLWVQSDKIKFSDSAEDGKWLEYNLSGLDQKNLAEELWAGDWSNSSLSGTKVGNEKIGKNRCFKYSLEDIEIGSAFSAIGLPSEIVQSASGNVWIGIKDKLIHKLELEITPATSSSITAMTLTLKFDDFGQEADFTAPDSLDVITDPTASTSTQETTTDTTSETADQETATTTAETVAAAKAAADALIVANDQQRKADLSTIKNALESYKSKYGNYPKSTSSMNLGVESNIVSTALIPNYIATMPKDPKSLDGWFYGYKSLDGKSYYLSTRLESLVDPSLKIVDNISLYFLYNN